LSQAGRHKGLWNLDTDSKKEQLSEFELLLEEVRKQLLDAQIHFDIGEQLWPTAENVDVLNAYKGFFLPTRNAHFDRFCIKISNVVSNDRRAPSFYRLLNMISSDPSLAPSINTRLLPTQLKAQKNLLETIQGFRDKRAAHWDTGVSEQIDPVKFGESHDMLKKLQDIFNEISGAHGNQIWVFKPMEHRDAARVLSNLRRIS
jgi:hypothetical protein